MCSSDLLSEFLVVQGVLNGSPDLAPFDMRLLHFRRTFVEKLFAIDLAVTATIAAGLPLGPYARHYFDLCVLSSRPEVLEMLRGPEYRAIVRDCWCFTVPPAREPIVRSPICRSCCSPVICWS